MSRKIFDNFSEWYNYNSYKMYYFANEHDKMIMSYVWDQRQPEFDFYSNKVKELIQTVHQQRNYIEALENSIKRAATKRITDEQKD